MGDVSKKIKDIEDEMARTQKNKATSGHLGMLKAKLAKLKREQLEPKSGGGSSQERGFEVKMVGDARIGLVGFPSVGKSTLLCKMTGTFSEVAAYEFTTLTAIPGMIYYQGAKLQLLDLPGIIEGAADGKGRGRQVISMAKTCSVILMVLDSLKPLTHKKLIEKELEGFGIRLNKKPPNISFHKRSTGGVNVVNTREVTEPLPSETINAVMKEYRIVSADICFRENSTVDDLIDVVEGTRAYIPCIYCLNKIDQLTLEELELIGKVSHYCPLSGHLDWNLDGLLEHIWEYCDMIRVYTKPKGQDPDWNEPIVLPRRKCTVEDFCNKIHKLMMNNFKHALVYGQSAKHRPQRVGKDHVLKDEDIVQVVKFI